MNIEQFRNKVIEELKVDYMFSYCPICYCLPLILNSHRCEEGWRLYFESSLSDEDKIQACVSHMKKNKHEPLTIDNK